LSQDDQKDFFAFYTKLVQGKGRYMIEFGREICGDLASATRREWLVTNGIGGYASGTVAGILTRRYHGLLIAATKPPTGRTLFVSKLDEVATYNGHTYPLFANAWSGGLVDPSGFANIERFHLEGTTPVWTFAIADALLEKRIWMQAGENTTYIRYDLVRGNLPLELSLKALVNYRDHHSNTEANNWQMNAEKLADGLKITAFDGATPFYLLSKEAGATPYHDWYNDFALSVEAYRGLNNLDDNLFAGQFHITLQVGEPLTIVASTEAKPNLNGRDAYIERQAYEEKLLMRSAKQNEPAWIQQLVLAADQFIVKRAVMDDPQGRSVIAGYHWFGDWGRDTMISLPGLTLAIGRFDDAAKILKTFAKFVDQGMLPNRFPDAGETPEYNTVDATLWYFEAIRAYLDATDDESLLKELFPVLESIITFHQRGTRYHIHADADGLLYSGEAGVQLTWMDAKVGDWVVTPRTGKAVEINALWYNALCIMSEFAKRLGKPSKNYDTLAKQVQASFERFWNDKVGYLYDVIDTPQGDDVALRPNQLFVVSLPHSPLSLEHQKAVVDTCAKHLLTSYGLRGLAANDLVYVGHYGGDMRTRDAAYHQGTVWSWLIGAHLRVYKNPALAKSFLLPLEHHLSDAGLGTISEIFDGDAPFTPRGCMAQAWGVAEILRAWQEVSEATSKTKTERRVSHASSAV
jgi:predicted glycogen debranching enzyme